MILGLGSDIVQIPRIEAALARFGSRFESRIFTEAERSDAAKQKNAKAKACFYAKRFAAKEACAKALGTGFRGGMALTDIAVTNDGFGKPSLLLTGAAALRLEQLSRPHTPHLHLTLSDDYPAAFAVVIISY